MALAAWWLRRNPLYLLSAAAMAVGAKLYLFAPDARAGDIGLILLTLATVQLYELVVGGIIVALHRAQRSPEDQPSLLLVGALFWTGPLAATLELTEVDAHLGLGLGAAAAVLALAEMATVRRVIGLQLSPAARMIGPLVLLLIAAAPARLRVPYAAAGMDELALYACWWLLAVFALFVVPAIRWHAERQGQASPPPGGPPPAIRPELAFLAVVFASAATHLYAMNYVFYGHARLFYAAPLLIGLAAAGFELAAQPGLLHGFLSQRRLLMLSAIVPATALLLCAPGFHPTVPKHVLPVLLREPLVTAALLAGLVWWYGAARHRRTALLHAGTLALAFALYRTAQATFGHGPAVTGSMLEIWRTATLPCPLPLPVAAGFAGLAVYLLAVGLYRRGRLELAAALLAQVAAVAALVWGRVTADQFILLAMAGWSLLGVLHIVGRPGVLVRLVPLGLLVALSCGYEGDDVLRWIARLHAMGVVVVLLTVGWLWPQTRYRALSLAAGVAWLLYLIGRTALVGRHPGAALAVTVAFLLLFAATVISWHKRRLLEWMHEVGDR